MSTLFPSGVRMVSRSESATRSPRDDSMPRFDPGSVAPSGVVNTPRMKGVLYPVATTRLPASFESASA